MDTVYLIGLYFRAFVANYHINVQAQENLHYLFTLGIRGVQSCLKSGNFMFFAFFVIFN